MQRSTGVTVSAVFVFLGCGLMLLLGGLMAFTAVLVPQQASQPPFMRYFLVGSVLLNFAFSIWGIASGVGLLLLRKWARMSMLIFCGILLFFTLPGLLMVPFLPLPQSPDSSGDFVLVFKIGMALFYAVFAAIGGGWLYFFNRRSVKEQFFGPEEMAALAVRPSKRPVSITIIGWILVVTACVVAPFTLFFHYPMLCLGFVLAGWSASLFMLTWCVVQGIAGVGLLRLRSWGRALAIGLFSFGFLNCAAIVLVPGATARFLRMNAESQARLRASMGLPTTDVSAFYTPEMMHTFIWFGVVFALLASGLQLWFVVSRKTAFSDAPEAAALAP